MNGSTEVTVHDGKPEPVIRWEEEMKGANFLFRSGLCPKSVTSAEAALFIILAGRDLGLSAVSSLRGITVIQGKVEVSADLQLGMFHRAGGRSQWEELTDARAAIRLTAPWLTSPHTSSFSMEDAKRAGLLETQPNYKKYPKAMLRSRAITQGLKDIGFDPTAGVYAPGELSGEAVVEEDTEEVKLATASGPAETGEAPTQVQKDLFVRSLRSPIWTDEERDEWTQKMNADGMTKKKMSELLEQLLVAGHGRKAAQVKATDAATAGVGSGAAA